VPSYAGCFHPILSPQRRHVTQGKTNRQAVRVSYNLLIIFNSRGNNIKYKL
jgi:hypothetical protein